MAKTSRDCVFCRIVAGELPSHKVYEDDHVVAFLDIMPARRGHTLVVPKMHCETLVSISPEAVTRVAAALPRVAAAVVAAVHAEGFNVLQSNGACAGQVVPHVHFHIVPRNTNDGLGLGLRQSDPVTDDLAATAESIRCTLNSPSARASKPERP